MIKELDMNLIFLILGLFVICTELWERREENGMDTRGASPKGTEAHHSDLKLSFIQHQNINNKKFEMELEEYLN